MEVELSARQVGLDEDGGSAPVDREVPGYERTVIEQPQREPLRQVGACGERRDLDSLEIQSLRMFAVAVGGRIVGLFFQPSPLVDAADDASAAGVVHSCAVDADAQDGRQDEGCALVEERHDSDGVDALGVEPAQGVVLLDELLNDVIAVFEQHVRELLPLRCAILDEAHTVSAVRVEGAFDDDVSGRGAQTDRAVDVDPGVVAVEQYAVDISDDAPGAVHVAEIEVVEVLVVDPYGGVVVREEGIRVAIVEIVRDIFVEHGRIVAVFVVDGILVHVEEPQRPFVEPSPEGFDPSELFGREREGASPFFQQRAAAVIPSCGDDPVLFF